MCSLVKEAHAAVAAYKTTQDPVRDAQRVRECVWRLARHCLITCGDKEFVKTLDELNVDHRVEECMRAGGSCVNSLMEMMFPGELQSLLSYRPDPEPEFSDYFQALLNPEFVDRLERLCTWSPAGYTFWTHVVMATVDSELWFTRHGEVPNADELIADPLQDEEARASYIAMKRGPGRIKDRVASCPPAFEMPIMTLAIMCALHDTDEDAVYFLRDIADFKLDRKRQRLDGTQDYVTVFGEIPCLYCVVKKCLDNPQE